MAVKIRLTRIGKKNAPVYRLVAVDERKKRDGAYLEDLGTYNPVSHTFVQFREDRLNDWIAKGAVMSEAVRRLKRIHQKKQ